MNRSSDSSAEGVKPEVQEERRLVLPLKENRLLFSGALGISIAFTGLLPFSSEKDLALTISLLCFAVSIPVMAACVYLTTLGIEYGTNPSTKIFDRVATAGLLVTFLGLVFLFWHFFWLAGIVFLGISVAAFLWAMKARGSLRSTTPAKD